MDAVAESSPAHVIDTPATDAAPVARKSLRELTPTERLEWRKTGDLPVATPKDSSAVAEPQPPAATEPPASTDATTQPASEPAKPKNRTEARIQELLADRKTERDRAERLERELTDLRRQITQPTPPAASAASAPAPAGLVEPNPEDTTKYPWGTADKQYIKDMIAYGAAMERAASAENARRTQATEEWNRTAAAFQERCEVVAKDVPDFKAVALEMESPIPRGSVPDLAIWEDENGPRVLYHLHKNPAEVARILKLSVWNQTKELVRLSDRLAAKPASESTQAPEPITVLPTRGSTADPIASAIKTRNFTAYRDNVNNEELARRHRRA